MQRGLVTSRALVGAQTKANFTATAADWLPHLAMIDTQNDSIQSLNFGKNGFNSIIDSILVSQNSIQTIIQFKKNCGDSIQ